jgi:hypothetical protein
MAQSPFGAALAAMLLLGVVALGREEFPDFAKLPVQKEMPDPLTMLDGRRVATKEQWFKERVPELKGLFQHYMYGDLPPPVKVEAKIEHVNPNVLDGKATLKDITLTLGGKHQVQLLLVIPNERKGPVPVFVGLNFAGNHAVLHDPAIRVPTSWMYGNRAGVKDNKATEAGRGNQVDVWAIEETIDRGFSVATVY